MLDGTNEHDFSDSEPDVSNHEQSVNDNLSLDDVIAMVPLSPVQPSLFNWFEIVDTIPDIQMPVGTLSIASMLFSFPKNRQTQ